jgi:hypothetical protein
VLEQCSAKLRAAVGFISYASHREDSWRGPPGIQARALAMYNHHAADDEGHVVFRRATPAAAEKAAAIQTSLLQEVGRTW